MIGQKLFFSFDNQTIFDNASFNIGNSDKVGITGVNGAGKTTLFKLILKELKPDKGSIITLKNTRISYLPQLIVDDLSGDDVTVFEYLLSARPIENLNIKLENLYNEVAINPSDKILKSISKVQEELEYWDQYNAEEILLKIISGMNIDEELLDKKVIELSGGQKSKIAFARLLYSKPEIILLDEPTNHMDKYTKDYITSFLKSYNGMILIISHDTKFLNEVTNKTLFLDKRFHNITMYNGNYDVFKSIIKSQEEQLLRQIEVENKEEERLKKIILQYSNSSGKRKKMAQSREKQLEKLQNKRIVLPPKQKEIKLDFKVADSSRIPIKINNLSFGYEKVLFSNLNLDIYKNEKILILGKNGVGKTTLLKLINDILVPTTGQILKTNKTHIAYYAQEHEGLDENKTIIDNFSDMNITVNNLRSVLGRFLFYDDEVYKKIKVLSPGERSRVALAKLMLTESNVLLLDEPTNHLDVDTKNIIAKVLKDYNGTIILVSHDYEFTSKLDITKTLLMPDGILEYYDNDKVLYFNRINTK